MNCHDRILSQQNKVSLHSCHSLYKGHNNYSAYKICLVVQRI